jgi:hypothetical protein
MPCISKLTWILFKIKWESIAICNYVLLKVILKLRTSEIRTSTATSISLAVSTLEITT